MKILVVEDQNKLSQLLVRGLTEASHTVTSVASCAEADDALSESSFDGIVLDLGLPDGDGLTMLKRWRLSGFTEPVLILSARDSLQDKISGLDVGADDYLAKPFSLEELLARMRSLMRRHSSVKSTVIVYGHIEMDLVAHLVKVDNKPVDLTNREYALLEIFMQNKGRVLPRTMIAEKIWDAHYEMDTNLLDVYMSRLRAKLEGPGQIKFKTIRGVGYMLT